MVRYPSESVRNDPVVVSSMVSEPLSAATSEAVATGSMPRPRTAMSVALEVETSGPRSSIRREEVERTPPAE